MIRSAPPRARHSAVTRPIPRPDPVTRAIFPANGSSLLIILLPPAISATYFRMIIAEKVIIECKNAPKAVAPNDANNQGEDKS
jgi:hypothetical protein